MNDRRVYFIGAGASKQDRFPLTSELKHGIAWTIREQPKRCRGRSKRKVRVYVHSFRVDRDSGVCPRVSQHSPLDDRA